MENKPGPPIHVYIVTGLSGAGKSTALRVFEDLKFFTVDGLPASLAPEIIDMMHRPSMAHFRGIALGMDIRQSAFQEELARALEILATRSVKPRLWFITADVAVLIRRYAQTRRPHPLEKEGLGLEASIIAEQQQLLPLKEQADFVIDTSHYSIHDLRRLIQKTSTHGRTRLKGLRVNIISFGFKYGVPKEADFVFDLRFLTNPYFVETLRPLSGQDLAVQEYIFSNEVALTFREHIHQFFEFVLQQMEIEGRYRVAIAMGCTGGRHRSVAFAEELADFLRQADYPTSLEHRHLRLD